MPDKIEITDENFPGNSDSERKQTREITPKKNLQRVVKGRAVKRKKTLGSNLARTFLGDDTRSVGAYILYEVLIPAAKNTLQDIVTGGIEMLLFGESSRNRPRRRQDRSGRSIVSYSSYYKDRDSSPRRIEPSHAYRRTRQIEDVIIEDRGEAEDVLESLQDTLEEYEVVSVADLYELAGFDSRDWTDTKWGWDDLRHAKVVRVRGGYMLDLPDPIAIEN